MLTIVGNNFGGNCTGQQLKVVQDKYHAVVNGSITVDSSQAAYKQATVLEIKVEGLVIKNSGPAAVYATMFYGGIHRITVVRAWFEDQETLRIEKVLGWPENCQYQLTFQCLFIPFGLECLAYYQRKTDVALSGAPEGFLIFNSNVKLFDDWAFFFITFERFATAEPETPINLTLTGLTEDIEHDFFLVYNDPTLEEYGSGYVDLSLVGNSLLIEDGLPALANAAAGRKFIKGAVIYE